MIAKLRKGGRSIVSVTNHEHSNALLVTTATRSDRAAETLSIVRKVVKEMAQNGPTEEELAATKK